MKKNTLFADILRSVTVYFLVLVVIVMVGIFCSGIRVVDSGNVAAFEPSVHMDIQQVHGAKNIFFGGEGLFHTVLTGPGRVWLQTMPIYNVANAIRPYIPTGNG